MAEKGPTGYINLFVNQDKLDAVTKWHNENWEKEHGTNWYRQLGYYLVWEIRRGLRAVHQQATSGGSVMRFKEVNISLNNGETRRFLNCEWRDADKGISIQTDKWYFYPLNSVIEVIGEAWPIASPAPRYSAKNVLRRAYSIRKNLQHTGANATITFITWQG